MKMRSYSQKAVIFVSGMCVSPKLPACLSPLTSPCDSGVSRYPLRNNADSDPDSGADRNILAKYIYHLALPYQDRHNI